jgi:hypothetical protein
LNYADLGFTKIISAIEAEIRAEYMPAAIRWSDEKFDGGWSSAMDRFDRALSEVSSMPPGKFSDFIQSEANLYKQRVITFLREFKKEKNLEDASSFLEGLGCEPVETQTVLDRPAEPALLFAQAGGQSGGSDSKPAGLPELVEHFRNRRQAM